MKASGVLSLIVLLFVVVESQDSLHRSNFLRDFLFGTASSAYQDGGAANEGGRTPSIWDTFTLRHPDKIKDNSNGSLAVDSYHRYKDAGIMKNIGFNAYRFSISWSRVIPGGSLEGGVNREGITYYNNLINELLSNGLQPFVTLFRWDLPQALEDAYGGFLSPTIVKDFGDYAELCYREFGERVKHWITLNEPLIFTTQGYEHGTFAPARSANSSIEPYIVCHHQILAHANAVKLYRNKYQVAQKGKIGITLNTPWVIPVSQSKADKEAASRALAFMFDWFMEPLNSGSYPSEMVNRGGERLLKFSKEQSLIVKGSFDFIGLNCYSATYAVDVPCTTQNRTAFADACGSLTNQREGVLIGPKNAGVVLINNNAFPMLGKEPINQFEKGQILQAASDWLYIYPEGIHDLLLYTNQKFNNPLIYITENGVDELDDGKRTLEDNMRIDYISSHLSCVYRAVQDGVNVKGYFAWSLLDNFEWANGYTVRFGIIYVDYDDAFKRYPKKSTRWFRRFLH